MQSGVPAHKVIPGTAITVDGFRYVQPWVKAYFLSHAHSDHYGGITDNWSAGPIYCSPVTAALTQQLTGVAADYLRPLGLGTPHTVQGVQVTLVDANHCPGAVQFLFELPDGRRYIHCGDMRYCADMQHDKQLARFIGADAVFLDTTYCHPKHTFPSQAEAVEFVASRIQQLLQEDAADTAQQGSDATADTVQQQQQECSAAKDTQQQQQQSDAVDTEQQQQLSHRPPAAQDRQQLQRQSDPVTAAAHHQQQEDAAAAGAPCAGASPFKRLYLISTYVIGKERLLLAVAQRTGHRLLVTQRKMEVLRCIGLSSSQLLRCFTLNPCETPIQVCSWGSLGETWPYFRPNFTNMEAARQAAGAQEVVGFVPTGWLYELQQHSFPSRSKGRCSVQLVPYSEHSSYTELRAYVRYLRPKQVIPTVGVGAPGAAGAKAREAMLKHFRGLLDEKHNKAAFLAQMAGAGRRMTTAAANNASKAPAAAAAAAIQTPPEHNVDGSIVVPSDDCDNDDKTSDNNDDIDDNDDGDDDSLVAAASHECQGVDEDRTAAAAPAETLHASTAAAAGSTPPKALHGPAETAGVAAAAAAAAPAQAEVAGTSPSGTADCLLLGSTAAAGVDVLLAITGTDLTAAEAQQLLDAAAGDLNAALNAFLDKQASKEQQQQQSLKQVACSSGSSGGGTKRQLSGDGKVSAGSSKKVCKPGSGGAATAAGHQAAITSFFSPAAAKLQQNKQQRQQQGSNLSQQQAPSPERGFGIAAAAAAGTPVRSAIVLPPLHRKPAAAAAAAAAGRKQSPVSHSPPVGGVDQSTAAESVGTSTQQQRRGQKSFREQQQQQHSEDCSNLGTEQPTPAAEAGTVLGRTTHIRGAAAAAAATRVDVAPRQAPSPPQQQQQQQWSALLPGMSLRPVKLSTGQISSSRSAQQNSATPPAAAAAAAQKEPAAAAAAAAQKEPAAANKQHSSPPPMANPVLPLPAAAERQPDFATAAASSSSPSLGTKGSSSSSKELTKAIREAPLLPVVKYHPVAHACWSPAAAAPYLAVALTLAAIDGTSSRLRIADGLTNLFRSLMLLAPEQVTAAAYLICGKIGPEYVPGAELSVGGGVVSSALSEVCGLSRSQLRSMYSSYGDLGDLAQACRRRQSHLLPPPPLTVQGVFSSLHTLAAQSGQGATARRQATIAKLLRCCRDVETKYLVRTLLANLRVGAAWKSVLGPLAKAALLHRKMMQEAGLLQATPPSAAAATGQNEQQQQQKDAGPAAAATCTSICLTDAEVNAAAAYAASSAAKVTKQQLEAAAAAAAAAYHRCPNLGIIVTVLLCEGPEALCSRVQLTCGVPVKPMLAKGCSSVADSFKQLAATAAAAVAAAGGRGPRLLVGKGGRRTAKKAAPPPGGIAAAAADRSAAPGKGAAAAAADSEGVASGDDSGNSSSSEAAAEPDEDLEPDEATQDAFAAAAAAGSAAAAEAVSSSSSSSRSLSVLAEYKYDGQRAQIHIGTAGQVHIFSRNCEDRTASFPDVVQAMLAAAAPEQLPLVVDAELVAVDRAHGNRVRAFQELATRPRTAATAAAVPGAGSSSGGMKRSSSSSAQGSEVQRKQQKLLPYSSSAAAASPRQAATPVSVDTSNIKQQPLPQTDTATRQQQQQQSGSGVDICVFVFDALCVAGRDMMGVSLRQRREALQAALPGASPGVLQMAEGVELQVPLAAAAAGMDANTAAAAAKAANAAAPDRATVGSGAAAAAAAASSAGVSAAAASGAGDTTGADGTSLGSAAATAATTPPAAADWVLSAEAAGMEVFHAALAAGSEGLMLKLLDGPGSVYQAAQRGLSWVKLKRDYLEGLADSLDLVPIGAWRGQGRKVSWFSPFLLAVYDPDRETYQSLCRCMSGFTDDFYAAATARLGATVIAGPKQYYDTKECPDVWFEPTEVWEIRGADITISPVHRAAAGLVDPAKGLGLRFPRFLRLRPDKQPEEASGPDSVQHLYNQQHRRIRRD